MKRVSLIRKLTAAILSCMLCCTGMTVPAVSADDTGELPARFDWREEAPEILTPVKTQVGGNCWAHAAIGCIESNLILKGLADNSIDFSEAHLIWFTRGQGAPTDPDDPRFGGGYNLGVNAYDDGGHHLSTIASLSAWQGVVNEKEVPPHSEKPELDESVRYQSEAHLQNAQFWGYNRERDSQYMKHLIAEKGPLSLAYFQNHSCKLSDQSGYYNPEYSAKAAQSADLNGGNHAVMAVGWDDNYPKENFTHEPPGDGAWIIRNSYGEKYKNSERGYFYLSYYEPSIIYVSFFDCESTVNYGSNYSYHGTNLIYTATPGTQYGYYTANVFEAEKAEKLAAAGFFVIGSNSDPLPYELSVYILNPDSSDPQDGTLVYKSEGTKEKYGFYTVKFPESIAVEQGQKYSVVLKTPIKSACYFDGYCYKKGVSYYAYYTADSTGDQQNWKDCYENELGDACLHVYTEYEGETAQILRGDMNRDGRLTAADLSLMKQAIRTPERSDLYQPAADCNGDNEIYAEDARGLLNFLLTTSEQESIII